MATELATAYISLIPELKGAGKSIASQLGGVDVAPVSYTHLTLPTKLEV